MQSSPEGVFLTASKHRAPRDTRISCHCSCELAGCKTQALQLPEAITLPSTPRWVHLSCHQRVRNPAPFAMNFSYFWGPQAAVSHALETDPSQSLAPASSPCHSADASSVYDHCELGLDSVNLGPRSTSELPITPALLLPWDGRQGQHQGSHVQTPLCLCWLKGLKKGMVVVV